MSAGAALPDRLPVTLTEWIAGQRWYQNSGSTPQLTLVGEWALSSPPDGTMLLTHLLLDTAASVPTLYQVPLSYRRAPLLGAAEQHLVGTVDTPDGASWVYDAPHDAAYSSALVDLIMGSAEAGSTPASSGASAHGHRHPSAAESHPASSQVLRGEQSNTSIIVDTVLADGTAGIPIICKIFRTLHHGENPDIVVQSALAAAGCTLVPPPVGHVSGLWHQAGPDGGVLDHGHLAFAQQFLPGVRDAWRVALDAVESGEDFSESARTLGIATAEVHALLAEIMPTVPATAGERSGVAALMRQRLAMAVAEVPELAVYADAVQSVISGSETADWPRLQRIHGDYHLGQVVSVPGRGWVLLDFEGEPLRPLSERSQPDLTLRDIAGMLRSFDYVGGSYEQSHPGDSAAAWVLSARQAFLEGYAERSGIEADRFSVLLDAFEIDKALYESIYESRNRPAWLPIPVTAISRLVTLP